MQAKLAYFRLQAYCGNGTSRRCIGALMYFISAALICHSSPHLHGSRR